MNYFIPALNEAHQRKLQLNHVPFSSFRVGTENGVLVEGTALEGVLQVLGLKVESEGATTYLGIKRLNVSGSVQGGVAQFAAPRNATPTAAAITHLQQEIYKLQAFQALPDDERQKRILLVAEAKRTEELLRGANDELRGRIAAVESIKEHVSGLKQFELPEALAQSLDAFVGERNEAMLQNKSTRDELATKLKADKAALAAHISQPVLSPEDTIGSADEALAEADEIVIPQP